ncbi:MULTISPECIES: tRNA epoxyqueuosine(34) reductase QueG [unclassified Paraflavitalea]|uniref:tRNA epoxyqueuosine(34) reductase QueG n=1 Tax=unclassified Paraflavitalea TaxID=2798305 RepID=UPI003D32DA4D
MSYAEVHTQQIKHFARGLGFDYCGIAKAEKLDEEARKLENWLNKGYHGTMKYMEGHFDLRTDPRLLVPGAKSVLTLLFNYYPSEQQPENLPKVSKYAYGKDYHDVIRAKLHALLQLVREHVGEVGGRGFVDSAPVLERAWAVKSGLGWIGKNGNLITKQQGSFFFIATLILDLELIPDAPYAKDFCGSCTRCIDQCPTEAILPNKEIDGSKCISYYTIELKAGIEAELPNGSFQNWMFGCDVCQDVCPWNRFSAPHQEPAFKPLKELFQFEIKDWEALTEETFKELFRNSPIKRTKFEGIRRNLKWIKD